MKGLPSAKKNQHIQTYVSILSSVWEIRNGKYFRTSRHSRINQSFHRFATLTWQGFHSLALLKTGDHCTANPESYTYPPMRTNITTNVKRHC